MDPGNLPGCLSSRNNVSCASLGSSFLFFIPRLNAGVPSSSYQHGTANDATRDNIGIFWIFVSESGLHTVEIINAGIALSTAQSIFVIMVGL